MTTRPLTSKVFTVASGKGGVGKTSLTLNMALALAKLGQKVLILDGDTGLANADVQSNLRPEADLADVITGRKTLSQALTPVPQAQLNNMTRGGVYLLAGRAGHHGLATLTGPQLDELFSQLLPLSHDFDLTLIDAAAGVTPITLSLCARAAQTLLVATPDPSSYIDAYALVKLLWQTHGLVNAQLIMNQASTTEARDIHRRIGMLMEKTLNIPALPHLATIPADRTYAGAVRHHQLAGVAYPSAPAVQAIAGLAQTLARLIHA